MNCEQIDFEQRGRLFPPQPGEECPDFRLSGEHGLTEGMAKFIPIYKALDKIPLVRNISNKIVVLSKGNL